jgi:hypothetical protein
MSSPNSTKNQSLNPSGQSFMPRTKRERKELPLYQDQDLFLFLFPISVKQKRIKFIISLRAGKSSRSEM